MDVVKKAVGLACVQDEYDEVEEQYKIEKAQLTDLELRFEPLDAEFKAILEERDVAYRARLTEERNAVRKLQAALALQAWWRSYRVRKACQVMAKKRAKAAGKGKKDKKGKEKGKGKKGEETDEKPVEEGVPPGEAAGATDAEATDTTAATAE